MRTTARYALWTGMISGLVFTFSVPMKAEAGDVKRYSPVECVALGTNQSLLNYNTGRVFNTANYPVTVYCPVVSDRDQNPRGYIYLWDRSRSANFRCALRSQAPKSTSYYYSTVVSVDASVPFKYGFRGTSYYSEPNRYIYCSIPGAYNGLRSAITAYSVEED